MFPPIPAILPFPTYPQENSKPASLIQVCLAQYLHYTKQTEPSFVSYKMSGLQDFIIEHLGHPWEFVELDAAVSLLSAYCWETY